MSERPQPTNRQISNAVQWFRMRTEHEVACPQGVYGPIRACTCGRTDALRVLAAAEYSAPNEALGAVPDPSLELTR